MSNAYHSKISNVLGTPIFDFAKKELDNRAKNTSLDSRNDTNITYLANKSAWVRLISSVNVKDSNSNIFSDLGITNINEEKLAKDFVLFGGTSKYNNGKNELRFGIDSGGAYNILNVKEVQDFGYKPMPGITNVTIQTQGRLGSLRQATINFKVHDKYQLDIIDALYFRLGYTMLLEWGNTFYYSEDELKSSDEFMIPAFDVNKNWHKEKINTTIAQNIIKSSGNYDGMLGIVTNFNFTSNTDGSYDCVLKLVSLGILAEDTKIDNASTLNDLYIKLTKKYLEQRRDADIAAAEKEADEEKEAAVQKLADEYSKDAWLRSTANGIDNPELANLIYNQQPDWFKSAVSKFITETEIVELQRASFNESLTTPTDVKFTRPESYDPKKINELVEEFKIENDLSKYTSTTNDTHTYSVNGKNGDILYFENTAIEVDINSRAVSNPITNKNYIKAGKDIKVTLDVNLINKIITERDPNKLDIISGVKSQENWSDNTKTFFDVLTNENNLPGLYEILYNKSIENKTAFYLQLQFLTIKDGRAIDLKQVSEDFLNDKSQYYVENIKVSGFNNSSSYTKISFTLVSVNNSNNRINLGFDSLSDSPVVSRIADLSFIKIIEGDQPLFKNEYTEELETIQRTAQQNREAKLSEIDTKYNSEIDYYKNDNRSAIELMLRGIEYYAEKKDESSSSTSVNVYNLYSGPEPIYKSLFTNGLYSEIIETLITTPYQTLLSTYGAYNQQQYIDLNKRDRAIVNAVFGNNHNLLSGFTSEGNLIQQYIPVNYKEMFNVWSLPYGIPNEQGEATKKYYITFGMLLMMLNHVSLLYDMDNETTTPLFYVDYNPNTNFMLSSGQHISVDTNKFLTPFLGAQETYAALFDDKVLNSIRTTILGITTASIADQPIWDPIQDNVSAVLPDFKSEQIDNKGNYKADTSGYYRAKIMNVLISIEYAIDVIKQFYKTSSNANSAYFKGYIDRLLQDLTNSMGNYNSLRLAYVDQANCFVIVDDQLQQSLGSEGSIYKNTNPFAYEMPLFGKNSLATALSIRTNISTRINSTIAISANQKDQTQKSLTGQDFGWMNKGFKDRYVPERGGNSNNKNDTDELSDIQAKISAMKFDNVIKAIYLFSNRQSLDMTTAEQKVEYIDQSAIDHATNYYMDKMSYVKSNQSGSVASFSIPLSLEFTIDGISGIYPMQAFTVNQNVLPYSYRNAANGYPLFGIGTITHTIQDNKWSTSYSAYMMKMRNSQEDYRAPKQLLDVKKKITLAPVQQFGPVVPPDLNITADEIVKKIIIEFRKIDSDFYSDAVIAGFLGNFYIETRFDSRNIFNNIIDDANSSTNLGLAQWQGTRRTQLINSFNWRQIEGQIQFVNSEITIGNYKSVKQALNTIQNTRDGAIRAGEIVRDKYEHPSTATKYAQALADRARLAAVFWEQMQAGGKYFIFNVKRAVT